ncbi:MAG: GNAT family N-acetyltransferase [Planctomycetes bacterium]|nr:GNAT family N-acetyltransferase [Planctomycetota bacterium]
MTATVRYRLDVSSEAPGAAVEGVRGFLRVHNESASPSFWRKHTDPATAPRSLHVIAYDEQGAVAGGLLGETFLAWLKIHILAVREDLRRQGIGAALLEHAEAEALLRGCRYAYADTMEYQAPDFYLRRGYATAGLLPDWDSHGHAKHFFIKRLDEAT